MTKRIRITGPGIHGRPTADNPTGEYPIGYEFDTDGDLPAGWVGRAVVVGAELQEESVFLTGVDDGDESEGAVFRRQVIRQAQGQIDTFKAEHDIAIQTLTARAERAEQDLAHANEQVSALNLKLAAFEQGATNQGDAATADEIATAITMLDGKTDAHWTAAGLPAVDAVAELTGKAVTRKAIEEAAPDAKRPTE